MKKLLLFAFIGSLLLTGCSLSPCGFTKSQFINNHENLVSAAKKNKKSWSKSNWESQDEKMKQMVEECYEQYEADMTSSEIAAFWTGTGAYYYNRFGRGFLKELKSSEGEISRAFEKGLKSLEKDKEGFLKDWIRENVGDDIKGALDEVGEELKNLGDELQEWLEEE